MVTVGEMYALGGKDKEAAAREREERLNSARNKVSLIHHYPPHLAYAISSQFYRHADLEWEQLTAQDVSCSTLEASFKRFSRFDLNFDRDDQHEAKTRVSSRRDFAKCDRI
jgi:hypothetical protein